MAAPPPVAPPNPAAPSQALDARAVGLLLVMCVCLAVGQIAVKVAAAGISPIMQAALRSAFAAFVVGWLAEMRGERLFARDGTLAPAILVSVLFAAEFAFLFPGIKLTTAAHAVILLYTSPFVVAVGAHLLIPGDRLTVAKFAGLVLAFAGAACVVLGREDAAAAAAGKGPTLLGDVLCLGGALAWGALTLVIRASRLKRVSPSRVTFIQLLLSAPMLFALSLWMGEPGLTSPTLLHWACLGFSVVFVGVFVYTATTWLYTRYPASRVMAFLLLTPLFGVAAAHLLLGEALSPNLLAGLALLVAGLWLVNRPPSRAH